MTEYAGGEVATITMQGGVVYEGCFYDNFNGEWVTPKSGRLVVSKYDNIVVTPVGRVGVTKAEIDAAVKAVADIIGVGERGTRGAYTEIGGLYNVLDALGIRLTVVDQ